MTVELYRHPEGYMATRTPFRVLVGRALKLLGEYISDSMGGTSSEVVCKGTPWGAGSYFQMLLRYVHKHPSIGHQVPLPPETRLPSAAWKPLGGSPDYSGALQYAAEALEEEEGDSK